VFGFDKALVHHLSLPANAHLSDLKFFLFLFFFIFLILFKFFIFLF